MLWRAQRLTAKAPASFAATRPESATVLLTGSGRMPAVTVYPSPTKSRAGLRSVTSGRAQPRGAD